jgi:hypothetical protein
MTFDVGNSCIFEGKYFTQLVVVRLTLNLNIYMLFVWTIFLILSTCKMIQNKFQLNSSKSLGVKYHLGTSILYVCDVTLTLWVCKVRFPPWPGIFCNLAQCGYIYTQSNITNIIFARVHNTNTEIKAYCISA